MPQVVRTDTHTGITAEHERKLRRHAVPSAHFDPNETPVIIGAGASAGGGSTPDSVSGGAANATAVGPDAQATGSGSVAVGDGSAATGIGAVAVGDAAAADVTGVAIGFGAGAGSASVAAGDSANADGEGSVAIGEAAHAGPDPDGTSTAVGTHATATFTHSTALGANAAATAANQVMLGSEQDFVEIPGDSGFSPNGLVLTDTDGSGNRWIVQVTGGALVVSAAP